MGTTDYGTQTIIWDYKYPAKGSNFSKQFRDLVKPGVYKGGLLALGGGSNVVINPMTLVLNTDSDYCVKITTAESITISVAESTPVIYVLFSWADTILNFADILLAATPGAVPENGVILGSIGFVAGVQNSISYLNKTWGNYDFSLGYYKGLQTDQQITSIIATGTSPLNVASTTVNANLNADYVDGYHVTDIWQIIYPIGAIYISVVSTSPQILFGGTWVAFGAGYTLVGYGGTTPLDGAVESTYGETTHTLTAPEMPSHNHSIPSYVIGISAVTSPPPSAGIFSPITYGNVSGAEGGGRPHNNIQPSIIVYMWKRTA